MGQGGVIVDDTRRTFGQNQVVILGVGGEPVTLSLDLNFVYFPAAGEVVDLSGLKNDPPVASILNKRPADIIVTADAKDGSSKVLLNQAQAMTIQVSTINKGVLTFTRQGNLVRIVPSAPMTGGQFDIPLPGGGSITVLLFTLPGSGAGSNIAVDNTAIGCPGTNKDLQTSISFL